MLNSQLTHIFMCFHAYFRLEKWLLSWTSFKYFFYGGFSHIQANSKNPVCTFQKRRNQSF